MRILVIRDTEYQRLALLCRHVERAEHPVPQRQATAVILVEVLWIGRVVHLVVRGRHENAPERAAERNPHVRVLQVDIGVDEQHQDNVGVGERVLIGGIAEHVVAEAVGGRG